MVGGNWAMANDGYNQRDTRVPSVSRREDEREREVGAQLLAERPDDTGTSSRSQLTTVGDADQWWLVTDSELGGADRGARHRSEEENTKGGRWQHEMKEKERKEGFFFLFFFF